MRGASLPLVRFRFFVENTKITRNRGKCYRGGLHGALVEAQSANSCGGAGDYKRNGGEGEMDSDAAAVFPHAMAPVGAPSVYCCGGAKLA